MSTTKPATPPEAGTPIPIKAEVERIEDKVPKDEPRFGIKNMQQGSQWLNGKIYCQRDQIENRNRELGAREIDRTRCNRFWANQFLVSLPAVAYLLMQELHLSAAGTNCARTQASTLWERVSRLGAWGTVSVRRLVVHLSSSPKLVVHLTQLTTTYCGRKPANRGCLVSGHDCSRADKANNISEL